MFNIILYGFIVVIVFVFSFCFIFAITSWKQLHITVPSDSTSEDFEQSLELSLSPEYS